MKMKNKIGVFFTVSALLLLLQMSFISASLKVTSEAVSQMAILELNRPATFNLNLTNLGETDSFEIYTLVGLDIAPKEPFTIESGQTKQILLEVFPKGLAQYYSFEYKIKGEKSGIQVENLVVNIVNLKDAFSLSVDEISQDSEQAVLHIENKGGQNFDNIDATFNSAFFTGSEKFSLAAFEKKTSKCP